jgi:hypothetical protein
MLIYMNILQDLRMYVLSSFLSFELVEVCTTGTEVATIGPAYLLDAAN